MEESEKADSCQESNPGHLACAAHALSLNYDSRTAASPRLNKHVAKINVTQLERHHQIFINVCSEDRILTLNNARERITVYTQPLSLLTPTHTIRYISQLVHIWVSPPLSLSPYFFSTFNSQILRNFLELCKVWEVQKRNTWILNHLHSSQEQLMPRFAVMKNAVMNQCFWSYFWCICVILCGWYTCKILCQNGHSSLARFHNFYV